MKDVVEEVDKVWHRQNYDLDIFPQLASEALQNLSSLEIPKLNSMISEIASLELPDQSFPDAVFSDLPITLARTSKVHMDMYFWFKSDTSIHNHHFAGAFKVVKGSSYQICYKFDSPISVDPSLYEGKIEKVSDNLLTEGSVELIIPEDCFIHQVIHLEKPTITLCLRTNSLPNLNLWGFVLPKYKILYTDFNQKQKKWYQGLKNLHIHYPRLVPEFLSSMPICAGEAMRIVIQGNSGEGVLDPIHELILKSLTEKDYGIDFYEMYQAQFKMTERLKKFGIILKSQSMEK